MDLLIQKIINKEPGAIQLAKEMGSYAAPSLRPLVNSEDDDIRELAIRCLSESGGSELDDIFVNALSDDNSMVRAAALNGLNKQLSEESYPKLLKAYSKISDSQHRKEIALMLGRIDGASVNDLKRICENEISAEAREGCLAALAKLGDPQARAEFLRRLQEAKNRELKQFLEYVDYIKQLWALRGLFPVLEDKTPIAGTGICRMITGKNRNAASSSPSSVAPGNRTAEILRACDIAVNLIAKIAGNKFSFPVGAKNYDDAQLAEARQVLFALFSQADDW